MAETNKRILYVEDDEDSRELMRLVLSEAGYEVVTAASGADALIQARPQRFHLYIFDNGLEQSSGIELCRQIRGFDPHTPIVFCSGVAQPSDFGRAIESGAQAYFVKPLDFDKLLKTAVALLNSPSAKLQLRTCPCNGGNANVRVSRLDCAKRRVGCSMICVFVLKATDQGKPGLRPPLPPAIFHPHCQRELFSPH
jgi:DNA-binding response OmpR family regulator